MIFLYIFFLCIFQPISGTSLAEQFKQVGYKEFCDVYHGAATYEKLYTHFDELIEFFQANSVWAQKLYNAKERFIRSQDKQYYSTDFFGFYDESNRIGRDQIAFYYSVHFHEFICSCYPEFNKVPEFIDFLQACFEIQKSYFDLFNQAAIDLGIENIFSSKYGQPPILFKVVKYFPSYAPARPHYDGTVFSLFLDSTDNQSLLFSAYKSCLRVEDFLAPVRKFSRLENGNSILLIPGTQLSDFSLDPTPHIVVGSGKNRYAAIAFAMRPSYIPLKNEFSLLPNFKY